MQQDSTIKIETDVMPTTFGHKSRDFTSLLFSRQLNSPLFTESQDDAGVRGLLVREATRHDDLNWQLELDDDLLWTNGDGIFANDVLTQMRSIAASSPFKFLLRPLKQVQVLGPKTLSFKTRLPLDLPAVLSNPVFAPERIEPQTSTGSFQVQTLTPRRAVFRPNGDSPAIEFVLADNAEDGQRMFDEGITSLTCSTTYPIDRWQDTDERAGLHVQPLNISVDIVLPISMDKKFVGCISAAIDRDEIARDLHGLVEPLNAATDMWLDEGSVGRSVGRLSDAPRPPLGRQWLLVYPDFSPNEQLAYAVATQLKRELGLDLFPFAQTYEDYLQGQGASNADCFRLVLRASPWPDPISMILPYLQHSEMDVSMGKKLEQTVRAIAAAGVAERHELLREASTIIEGELAIFPIVRLRSITRTRFSHFSSPVSGWTNYLSNLPNCSRTVPG
ncbi:MULTISPECIES: hypothetical protein [unclassified Arthrobacter]|uniref:hypothetical protein n=1 Tax=unclassified Arthrobacter TaxID=235627 RepID=UPI0011B04112|nr:MULTISPECIES: hypothetical protein [unclassified Arthrobacter]